MREEIRIESLGPAISHYTDAVRFGDLLFISGVVAWDQDGNVVGNTEDNVTQGGMMPNSERRLERLGAGDKSLILRNSIFERELRALVDGAELTQWHRPERLQFEHVARFLGHQ